MKTNLTNEISPSIFNNYGELSLPKGARAYLDGCSSEFHDISIEQKLYHMGYLLKRDYDLFTDFKEDINRHMQDSQYGGYEDSAIHALGTYITFLRTGKKNNEIFENLTFKELYDMLAIELKIRYKETKDRQTGVGVYEFGRHVTEEDLKACNGWSKMKDNLVGYELYLEDEEFIYPDDEYLVKKHNAATKSIDNKFVLQVPPEPWGGDILNSKIVVLSLNPGYVEYLNKDLANMFKAQVAEEIMEDKRQMLNLEQKSLVPHKSTSILGDCYWEKALIPLGKAVYGTADFRQIYRDVAVLQFLAYTSTVKSLPNEILPSQQFTRMLVRYLAEEKKSVKFLLMRAKKEWFKLIDKDIWLMLEREGRLIISDNYRNQSFTEKNIGTDKFSILVETLKEK